MKPNNADTVIGYRVGDHFSFELPSALDQGLGLVSVRLVPGAWLERTAGGETVVCTHDYRFGARLMSAISLGLCTVEPLRIEELTRRPRAADAARA